jgi:hypothetical protein
MMMLRSHHPWRASLVDENDDKDNDDAVYAMKAGSKRMGGCARGIGSFILRADSVIADQYQHGLSIGKSVARDRCDPTSAKISNGGDPTPSSQLADQKAQKN